MQEQNAGSIFHPSAQEQVRRADVRVGNSQYYETQTADIVFDMHSSCLSDSIYKTGVLPRGAGPMFAAHLSDQKQTHLANVN